MARRFGARVLGVLWRLERQKRGAWHYHCLVAFAPRKAPRIAALRTWASDSWAAVVGSGDPRHLRAGTQCRWVTGADDPARMAALQGYLAKYMAKAGPTLVDHATGAILPSGRCWGTWGDVPLTCLGAVEFTAAAYAEVLRRLNAKGAACGSWYLSSLSERWAGFALVGDGPGVLLDLVRGVAGVRLLPRFGATAAEVLAGGMAIMVA
jgi:hypothetical protein